MRQRAVMGIQPRSTGTFSEHAFQSWKLLSVSYLLRHCRTGDTEPKKATGMKGVERVPYLSVVHVHSRTAFRFFGWGIRRCPMYEINLL